MRITIARKLSIGLGIVACLGLGALLVVYWGLATAGRAMQHLSEVEEPTTRAAHEMEINLKGVGLAVFTYLDSADARSRTRIEDDAGDFERFYARYLELAETDAETRLAATLGSQFAEFKALAFALVAKKDEQERAVARLGESLETLDDIIDNRLQGDPAMQGERAIRLLDVEADVAELVAWLATYQRTHKPDARALIHANEEELRRTLERFRSLRPTADEHPWVRELETTLDRTTALVREILAADDYLQAEAARFEALRNTVDDLLDHQLQPIAYEALYAPRREADQATRRVIRALHVLIPALLLAVLGVRFALMRAITARLTRLRSATAAIGDGTLSQRVEGMAGDELGDLAEDFNRMVARLEVTTVSKEQLEASDAQLRATVEELREQIGERLRAQAEQERLQESLRRSETMSAMGSLVAGVAHEVRNPLFAVSSTLDALEARLGPREETRPHLVVLRGEVERLNQLMRNLLDYGRPGSAPRVPASIGAVVDEAIRSCAPLAARAGVTIERRVADGTVSITMDQTAMVQAFRNLVENAIQHAPDGSTVTIEAHVARDNGRSRLHCAVIDAGPGFRAEALNRAFEPFFTQRRGGTGLGLALVQRVIDQHGGEVSAANGPRCGAVVTVRIPLAEPTAGAGGPG